MESRTSLYKREKEIIKIAEGVVKKHNLSPVIQPEQVADLYGIGVSFNEFDDSFLGIIRYDSSIKQTPFHIFINQSKHAYGLENSWTRSTCGHELGHYFIPEHRRLLESGKSLFHTSDDCHNYTVVEKEAQIFSSHLLMPSTYFSEKSKDFMPGAQSIIGLSKYFNTSILSCAFHYAKSNLIPCICIRWNADNKIIARWVSKPLLKSVNNILAFKLNPYRPIADHQIRHNSNYEITTSITNLSSWVFNFGSSNSKDILMIEESIKLGNYGGITLLRPTDYRY